jgi:hypothetical protein
MIKFGVSLTEYGDSLKDIQDALEALSNKKLIVGITGKDERTDINLTNSQLMLIHEYGAPEVKIPARPVLSPVLNQESDYIKQSFWAATQYSLRGEDDNVDNQLHYLGQYLVNKIKERILSHIPPLLKPKTLQARQRRGNFDITPLYDTHQLIQAFGYKIESTVKAPVVVKQRKTVLGTILQKIKTWFKF